MVLQCESMHILSLNLSFGNTWTLLHTCRRLKPFVSQWLDAIRRLQHPACIGFPDSTLLFWSLFFISEVRSHSIIAVLFDLPGAARRHLIKPTQCHLYLPLVPFLLWKQQQDSIRTKNRVATCGNRERTAQTCLATSSLPNGGWRRVCGQVANWTWIAGTRLLATRLLSPSSGCRVNAIVSTWARIRVARWLLLRRIWRNRWCEKWSLCSH